MSLNYADKGEMMMMVMGSGASAGLVQSSSALHAAAPRLGANGLGYASWRTAMDVHLGRTGAEAVCVAGDDVRRLLAQLIRQ